MNLQDASTDQLMQMLHQHLAAPEATPEEPLPRDNGIDVISQALQGATFGTGDEATAATAALMSAKDKGSLKDFDADYTQALDNVRKGLKTYQGEHPLASTGLQIAGGLPTAFIGGAPATIGGAMKVGAGYGAAYGAGSGEGVEGRLEGAVEGGVAGAALGGALQGISKVPGAVSKLATKGREAFVKQTPENRAVDILQTAMQEDQLAPRSIAARLDAAKKTGLPITALDVAGKEIGGVTSSGRNLQGLADAAANMPGRGAAKAGEVAARQGQQHARINKSLDQAFGKEGYYNISDDILNVIETDAKDAYEKAYAKEDFHTTDKLHELLNRPAAQQAIGRALKLASNEGTPIFRRSMEETFKDLPPEQIIQNVLNGKSISPELMTNVIEGFNTKGFDYIKRGLDDMIDAEGRNQFGKITNEGRVLTNLKKSILSEIDSFNPLFREARQKFGDQASRQEALTAGRDFTSMDKEEITRAFNDFSKGEKQAFIIGAKRAIQDRLDNLGDNADAVNRIWKESIRGKLEPLFGSREKFKQFAYKMQLEKRMAGTNAMLTRGSQTAPRQKYQEAINQTPETKISQIGEILTNPRGAALKGAVNFMSGKLRSKIKGINNETAAQIMDYLLTNDSSKWRKIESLARKKKIDPVATVAAAKGLKIPDTLRKFIRSLRDSTSGNLQLSKGTT